MMPLGFTPLKYDLDAQEYYGRVVSKRSMNDSYGRQLSQYQVSLLNGELIDVESFYEGFESDDCVKVFISEKQSSKIAYGWGCEYRRNPIEVVHLVAANYLPSLDYGADAIVQEDGRLGKGPSGDIFAALIASFPYGIIALPVVAGVAVITGGGRGDIGAVFPVPEEKVDEIETALHELATYTEIQQKLREALSQAGNSEGMAEFRVASESGPANHEAVKNYDHWQLQDEEIILESAITDIIFRAGKGDDPEIALTVHARTRLIPMAKGIQSIDISFVYSSSPKKSSTWFENENSVLRAELDTACAVIAKDIVDEFF